MKVQYNCYTPSVISCSKFRLICTETVLSFLTYALCFFILLSINVNVTKNNLKHWSLLAQNPNDDTQTLTNFVSIFLWFDMHKLSFCCISPTQNNRLQPLNLHYFILQPIISTSLHITPTLLYTVFPCSIVLSLQITTS